MGELKTSEEWYKEVADLVKIYDPDGWNRKNFEFSWYEELIDRKEFARRIARSTCQFKCLDSMFKILKALKVTQEDII